MLEQADFVHGHQPAYVEDFEKRVQADLDALELKYRPDEKSILKGLYDLVDENGVELGFSEKIAILEFFRIGIAAESTLNDIDFPSTLPATRRRTNQTQIYLIQVKDLHHVRNLAEGYLYQGRLWAGFKIVDSVARLYDKIPEMNHHKMRMQLLRADFLVELARFQEAEEILQESLDLCVELGLRRSSCFAYRKLAKLRRLEGRLLEAEEMLSCSWNEAGRDVGFDHPEALKDGFELASTLLASERFDEAEELFLELIPRQELALGETHPDTISTLESYSLTLLAMGDGELAEEILLQVIESRKSVQGLLHPQSLVSMERLAILYDLVGKTKEAEEMALQTLRLRSEVSAAIGEHTFNDNNYKFLLSIITKYRETCRLPEAERLALELWGERANRNVPQLQDLLLLELMRQMVAIYSSQFRFIKAILIAKQRVKIAEKLWGPGDCQSITSRDLVQNLQEARRAHLRDWIYWEIFAPWFWAWWILLWVLVMSTLFIVF